jgi:photosystem II stability/assembly factor-like uncharacterized protein
VSDWERLYARPGGTVAGFATLSDDAGGTVVCAATSAGVFTSGDAGRTWIRSSGGETIPFNEAICVSRDGTAYVGGRNGLYRSDDGASSWQRILVGARVLSLGVHGDLLLVGTEQDGVLRSEDRGRTFAGANAGLIDLSVVAMALSPEFERDGTAFLASTSGLYRTRNGGKSWRPLDVDAAVQCLCVSPALTQGGLVLAGTESEGLLRSDDAGAHWEPFPELLATSITAIAHSNGSAKIAAATELGIAISECGSTSWRMTAADIGPVLALEFATAESGEVLLAGLHRNGVARAVEPFDRWICSNEGLQARLLLALAPSPSFDADQRVFAAGPDDGVMVSTDAGRTWTAHLTGREDPRVFSIAAHDRSLFAATEAGVLRSRDAGATWSVVLEHGAASAVIAPARGRLIVALEHGRLLASDDDGETWRGIGADFDAEIVSVACTSDGTLFVGTSAADELTLWRCTADGINRERRLVERGGGFLAVAASPETVYVGAGTRVLSPIRDTREIRSHERRPLWRSVDLGASITALTTASDAQRRRVIFAATSAGAFVSRDGGESFVPWRADVGPDAILAIAASPNYARDGLVYALEVGGTIWRRRDTD